MLKLIYPLILILVFSSFSPRFLFNKHNPNVELSYILRKEAAQKLSEKYHMIIIGEGIRIPDGILNLLSLDFQIKGPLSRDELREILVDCVEEFLYIINSNKEIGPYLKNYPFTPENIDIALFLVGPDDRDVAPPNFCVAAARRNKIVFRSNNPSNLNQFITEEESYDEALIIVRRKTECNGK